MTMSKATGYSLWLVPERKTETYRFLDQFIRDVAAQYQTPVFDPHATLLGGVDGDEKDMREKTQMLAEKLAPYEIQLGEVGSNGIYFQILFSRVEQTPSVLEANAVAQKVFGVDKGKYFPHLSLAYGDLSNEQVAALKQFIAQRYPPITGINFLVANVELWRSEGAVNKWHRVATFQLKAERITTK